MVEPGPWQSSGLKQDKWTSLFIALGGFQVSTVRDFVPGAENGKRHHFSSSALHTFTVSGDLLCAQKSSADQRKACNHLPEREWDCDKEWRCGICKELLQVNKRKPNHPKTTFLRVEI